MGNKEKYVPSVFDGAGEIEQHVSAEKVEALQNAVGGHPVDPAILLQQLKTKTVVRDYKKVGRNEPCPCGAVDESGRPKKYKNCCMRSGDFETTHQV